MGPTDCFLLPQGTHMEWFTITCNSSFKSPDTFF